jgi:hypothetical protein
MVCQSNLSEDFLSRLEAGHLAHPFRGTVRRRILLLAWLVCRTPRDLKAYLKAAGLNDCNEEENALLHLLNEHLTAQQTPPPLLLPARPAHLKGREEELARVMSALSNPETHVFALTGMPGVGKSALAYEALHQLAAVESERLRHFPDGIATFTCTGRQGTRGLISLLAEITEIFTSGVYGAQANTPKRPVRKRGQNRANDHFSEAEASVEPELASVIDHARAALANKRVLILLDDLDPAFPLRSACDVLLTLGSQTLHEGRAENAQHEQRVILTTSQFLPAPALVSGHLHVQPLREKAALDLLSELVSEKFGELDLLYARQACAAVGYLPLAIENMATAIRAQSIPLALVATYLVTHPLGGLLDSEEEIVEKMERALSGLESCLRRDYLLLAALELPTFDLQTAAALLAPRQVSRPAQETPGPAQRQAEPAGSRAGASRAVPAAALAMLGEAPGERAQARLADLAGTAAILGQFVRFSLLELEPGAHGNAVCYHMHELLYHYARSLAHTLPADRLELAQQNLREYVRRG